MVGHSLIEGSGINCFGVEVIGIGEVNSGWWWWGWLIVNLDFTSGTIISESKLCSVTTGMVAEME